MDWISVDDRLPEEEMQHVLLWFTDVKCAFVGYLENGVFELSHCDWFVKYHPVSHWMPLPEPPKEKSEGQKKIDKILQETYNEVVGEKDA